MTELIFYSTLLIEIKNRIRQAQTKAILRANEEMIRMYWDIGHMIFIKQKEEGWGAKVIRRLSRDLHNELPEQKGFSERNIKFMVQLYKEYEGVVLNGKQTVSQIEERKQLVSQIPWGHNILLMQKIKDNPIRFWYMTQILQNSWDRNALSVAVKNNLYEKQKNIAHNFKSTLPKQQSELATQAVKDPYIFDFVTLRDRFVERDLEVQLVHYMEKFLIELGSGFAFVGRQYPIEISKRDFYLDLLFYHLHLRCFIIIELKRGEFKPEYAGKMNFYCSAVDDFLKQDIDNPTIGLILCQNKDKIFAEYALRDLNKPIGVSEYELTRALPDNLKSSLPSIEDIESELSDLTNLDYK